MLSSWKRRTGKRAHPRPGGRKNWENLKNQTEEEVGVPIPPHHHGGTLPILFLHFILSIYKLPRLQVGRLGNRWPSTNGLPSLHPWPQTTQNPSELLNCSKYLAEMRATNSIPLMRWQTTRSYPQPLYSKGFTICPASTPFRFIDAELSFLCTIYPN